MSSMEARRNPVNKAAAAFFLLTALGVAGILLKLAVPVHGHPVGASDVIALLTAAVIGILVQRGSLVALVVGTTLVALACLGAVAAGAAGRVDPLVVVVVVAFHGVLLFLMVRGIVALARRR